LTIQRPADLRPGQTILYKAKPHRIFSITPQRDQVHGRLYHLELEADGERVSVTVREGAKVETV
jgi:translation elongation factor P/translation initiation factor 5A